MQAFPTYAQVFGLSSGLALIGTVLACGGRSQILASVICPEAVAMVNRGDARQQEPVHLYDFGRTWEAGSDVIDVVIFPTEEPPIALNERVVGGVEIAWNFHAVFSDERKHSEAIAMDGAVRGEWLPST